LISIFDVMSDPAPETRWDSSAVGPARIDAWCFETVIGQFNGEVTATRRRDGSNFSLTEFYLGSTLVEWI
jgi:hypothetical protein